MARKRVAAALTVRELSAFGVHDTGDRKGVTEPAVEQKHIADYFWANADLSGEIDYQIAEGDLVATCWRARVAPQTLLGRFPMSGGLPIINLFRFRNGKIGPRARNLRTREIEPMADSAMRERSMGQNGPFSRGFRWHGHRTRDGHDVPQPRPHRRCSQLL